jgi:aspartyl-tRNA(Asn)/glutamyl-tRNA(Gln) amidotransferase subunit A
VANGEVSAVAVAQDALDRIAHHDKHLNAFLWVDGESALAQAAGVDRARARGGPLAPLAGVPIARKDNLCMRGAPTAWASKIIEGGETGRA